MVYEKNKPIITHETVNRDTLDEFSVKHQQLHYYNQNKTLFPLGAMFYLIQIFFLFHAL